MGFVPDSMTRGSGARPGWSTAPRPQYFPVADTDRRAGYAPPPFGDGLTPSLTVLLICDNSASVAA